MSTYQHPNGRTTATIASLPTNIFISYSRVDIHLVDQLAADLMLRGFRVWMDRSQLEGGQVWEREITKAIDESQVFLYAVSPDAFASVWVQRELALAQKGERLIIPIILRPVSQLPGEIGFLQWVSLEGNYQEGLARLLRALTSRTKIVKDMIMRRYRSKAGNRSIFYSLLFSLFFGIFEFVAVATSGGLNPPQQIIPVFILVAVFVWTPIYVLIGIWIGSLVGNVRGRNAIRRYSANQPPPEAILQGLDVQSDRDSPPIQLAPEPIVVEEPFEAKKRWHPRYPWILWVVASSVLVFLAAGALASQCSYVSADGVCGPPAPQYTLVIAATVGGLLLIAVAVIGAIVAAVRARSTGWIVVLICTAVMCYAVLPAAIATIAFALFGPTAQRRPVYARHMVS